MSFQKDRLKISEAILAIEDASLLDKIKQLIKTEQIDLWDELPDAIKTEVDLAIEELDQGKGIPHKEAMKPFDKWIKK